MKTLYGFYSGGQPIIIATATTGTDILADRLAALDDAIILVYADGPETAQQLLASHDDGTIDVDNVAINGVTVAALS